MTWKSWLDEVVLWDGEIQMQRRAAIHKFCKYGLIPFIETHGYMVADDLGSRIATGLYNNRGKSYLESDWSFGIFSRPSTSRLADYKAHFDYVVGSDEWCYFWGLWGMWCDVASTEPRGWDRQQDIQTYIWSQICIEESSQTQIINEILGIDEEENATEHDSKDVYLRDAAESNEWGGYRK